MTATLRTNPTLKVAVDKFRRLIGKDLTINCFLRNERDGRTLPGKVLIDTESNINCVTQNFANRLGWTSKG